MAKKRQNAKARPGKKHSKTPPPTEPLEDDFYDRWEAWGRKRSAWVGYLYARQHQRLVDEEIDYQQGNEETRAKIQEARKKRADEPRTMFIG